MFTFIRHPLDTFAIASIFFALVAAQSGRVVSEPCQDCHESNCSPHQYVHAHTLQLDPRPGTSYNYKDKFLVTVMEDSKSLPYLVLSNYFADSAVITINFSTQTNGYLLSTGNDCSASFPANHLSNNITHVTASTEKAFAV